MPMVRWTADGSDRERAQSVGSQAAVTSSSSISSDVAAAAADGVVSLSMSVRRSKPAGR